MDTAGSQIVYRHWAADLHGERPAILLHTLPVVSGVLHVRPLYDPQSNVKVERWHKSHKVGCIRPAVRFYLGQTREMVVVYMNYYNDVRLLSAIGYVLPRAVLDGHAEVIQAERQRRLT
jgi:putative transposase